MPLGCPKLVIIHVILNGKEEERWKGKEKTEDRRPETEDESQKMSNEKR